MQESGEMYLETILILSKKFNNVRAIDIVDSMGFSKASVSRALSKLKEDDCIVIDTNGHIAFKEKGRCIAERIYDRHVVLTRFLMGLGVDEKTATADACKMEHDISEATYEAMKANIKNTDK